VLFVTYSLAAASVYLALELKLVDGVPFARRVDAARGAVMLPVLLIGGIVVAIAVGLQYLLVFRSPAIVGMTVIALAVAAYFLTRHALGTFAVAMRYHLGLLAAESGSLYKEVG